MFAAVSLTFREQAAIAGSLLVVGIVCYALLWHFFSVVRAVARREIDPDAPSEPPMKRAERSQVRKLSPWAGVATLLGVFGICWIVEIVNRPPLMRTVALIYGIFAFLSICGAVRLIFAKRKSVEEWIGCVANLLIATIYLVLVLAYEIDRSRDYVSWRSDPKEMREWAGRLFNFAPPAGMRVIHLFKDGVRDATFWMEAEIPNLTELSRRLQPSERGKWLPPSTELPRTLPSECRDWWPDEREIMKMQIYQNDHDQQIKFGSGDRLYFYEEDGKIYGVSYSM